MDKFPPKLLYSNKLVELHIKLEINLIHKEYNFPLLIEMFFNCLDLLFSFQGIKKSCRFLYKSFKYSYNTSVFFGF